MNVDLKLLKLLAEDESALGHIARAEIAKLKTKLKLADMQCVTADLAIEALEKKLEDSETERVFWKSAAERALRLWGQSQDENEKLVDAIEVTLSSTSTSLSRENWARLETLLDE